MESELVFNKKKVIFLSIASGLSVIMIILYFSFSSINNYRQREELATTQSYIGFQEKINSLIDYNTLMLHGYIAYIKANPDISEAETLSYLSFLLEERENVIRNIGVLKDTTIIFTYPKATNEKAIGVDLSTIESQRDIVLRAKKLLKPVVQGPLELVQGGTGFIIRLPFTDEYGDYWGQVSVVLKAESVVDEVEAYADEFDLKIAVLGEDNGIWIVGGNEIFESDPLEYEIKQNLMNWKVYVVPKEGWISMNQYVFISILMSVIIGGLTGWLVYFYNKANFKIKHISYHDSLTGLYNRNFLEEYKELLVTSAERHYEKYGLILIDLDEFKKVNDTYGHKVGDLVLKETAKLLKNNSRTNEIVIRLGGDEFLIIVPKLVYDDELMIVKERIENRFEQSFHIEGYEQLKVKPSVGYASLRTDGITFEEVLHHADHSMYEDKYMSKMVF